MVFDHPYTTLPTEDRSDLGIFYPIMGHACHIPVVEVDVETGSSLPQYVAVHDCGTLINPGRSPATSSGARPRASAPALYEEFVYADGALLNEASRLYTCPPRWRCRRHDRPRETPSPFTPYGIKGGGEGGRMLTPAI